MTEPRRFGKYSKVIREQDDAILALCRQMEHIAAEKDAEIERLRQRLQDAETGLSAWDSGHNSEYWLRHPPPVSNGESQCP